MHRLLVTSELLFGWPHPKGIHCIGQGEFPYGKCFLMNPSLRRWNPWLALWWSRLSCKTVFPRLVGMTLYAVLGEEDCEVVFRQTQHETPPVRTFFRGMNGEREMASLPSPELKSIADVVIGRASRTSIDGDLTVGDLTTCSPDAKWKFTWDNVGQELRMTYVPGSFQRQQNPLHTPKPASAADLPTLIVLKDACIARMRADGIEQWDEVYPDSASFARDLAAGTLHVWRTGDPEAGIPTGCVTLDTTHDPLWQGMAWSAAGEPAAAVHRLMVHPGVQRRGLAKLLMAHAEALARAQGFRSIHLDCFTANPAALGLYERLGYRRTGTATMRKGPFVCFEKLLASQETM